MDKEEEEEEEKEENDRRIRIRRITWKDIKHKYNNRIENKKEVKQNVLEKCTDNGQGS